MTFDKASDRDEHELGRKPTQRELDRRKRVLQTEVNKYTMDNKDSDVAFCWIIDLITYHRATLKKLEKCISRNKGGIPVLIVDNEEAIHVIGEVTNGKF